MTTIPSYFAHTEPDADPQTLGRNQRTSWLAVMLVVLVAICLRVPLLDATGLWIDEVLTLRGCKVPAEQLTPSLIKYENAKPPLYWHIMRAWVGNNTDPGEAYFRLPGLIFGAIACGLMVMLGTVLVNRTTGLFAGLLLAISPLHIWHCVDARPFSLMHMFVCLSALGLARYVRSGKWLDLLMFCVGLSLACWSFSYAVLFGMVTFLIVLILWRPLHARKMALPLVGAHLLAALAFVPWVMVILNTYVINKGGAFANYESSALESIAMASYAVPYGFSMGPTLSDLSTYRTEIFQAHPVDSTVAGVAGLIFGAMILVRLLDRKRKMDGIDWLLLGSFVLLILLPAIPTILNKRVPYNPRYAMSALVPGLIFMAKFGSTFMGRGRRGLAGVLCALVVVLMLVSTGNLLFQSRYWREDIRAATALAAQHNDRFDNLIICAGQLSLPTLHHFNAQGGTKPLIAANAEDPATNAHQPGNPFFGAALDMSTGQPVQSPQPFQLKHADTYFLIYARRERGDPLGILPKWLEEEAEVLEKWSEVRGAQCYLFKRK